MEDNTIKGSVKEGAGYIEEELGEALHNEKLAQRGRNLRNEGRVEDGKMPMFSKPGSKK